MDFFTPVTYWILILFWNNLKTVSSLNCENISPCVCTSKTEVMDNRQYRTVNIIKCVGVSQELLKHFQQFQGTVISELSLKNNTFTDIPDETFENLTIHELDLSDSAFENVGDKAFSNIMSLRTLKLNNAGLDFKDLKFLTNLTELKVLSMDENVAYQVHFPRDIFKEKNLDSLKELSLSKCNIAKVPENTFEGLVKLEKLNLSSNQLRAVPEAILKLKHLKVLDVSYNTKISYIHNDAFSSLRNLKEIYIKGTENTRIESEAFVGLEEALDTLVLADGQLPGGYFLAKALRPLRSLKKLDLSNNIIVHMQNDSFDHFLSLQELDISGNPMAFTGTMFQGLELTLTTLKIRNMNLKELPLEDLIILEKLEYLDASENAFTFLFNRFFGVIKAKELILAKMNINKVESGAFNGMPGPISLNLDNNRISNISFLLELRPCYFKKLSLLDNPLICNCDSVAIFYSNISLDISASCRADSKFNESDIRDVVKDPYIKDNCDLMKYSKHQCDPDQLINGHRQETVVYNIILLLLTNVFINKLIGVES